MIFRKKILAFMLCFILLMGTKTEANIISDVSKFQAIFMTKFMDYVSWSGKKEDIVIGVLGYSKISLQLELALKARGEKTIVKKLTNISEIASCDVLFIPSDYQRYFKKINLDTAEKSLLIITETKSLAKKGSVITFYTEDRKLRFVVNQRAAEDRGFQISPRLLRLAKVI